MFSTCKLCVCMCVCVCVCVLMVGVPCPGLLFGVMLDSSSPRLLSVGRDRTMVSDTISLVKAKQQWGNNCCCGSSSL